MRAGDRLPDVPLTSGQALTLHQLTSTPGWHLLTFGTRWPDTLDDPLHARQDLLTAHHLGNHAGQRALIVLGLSPAQPALLLVRPDGHIGYRSTGSNAITGLISYLERWLKPRM